MISLKYSFLGLAILSSLVSCEQQKESLQNANTCVQQKKLYHQLNYESTFLNQWSDTLYTQVVKEDSLLAGFLSIIRDKNDTLVRMLDKEREALVSSTGGLEEDGGMIGSCFTREKIYESGYRDSAFISKFYLEYKSYLTLLSFEGETYDFIDYQRKYVESAERFKKEYFMYSSLVDYASMLEVLKLRILNMTNRYYLYTIAKHRKDIQRVREGFQRP